MANTLYFSTYYLVFTIVLYLSHISYLAYLILIKNHDETHYSIVKEAKEQRGSVTCPKLHSP